MNKFFGEKWVTCMIMLWGMGSPESRHPHGLHQGSFIASSWILLFLYGIFILERSGTQS